MGKRTKLTKICNECQNAFTVPYNSPRASICPTCIGIKKSIDIQQTAKELKDTVKEEYSKRFEFEFNTPDQKLSAVSAQGEAFASKGGVDLMITEFVENAFDAIKKKIILQALPEALKQLNFNPKFEKIAIEKYTTPITDFNKNYTITKDDELNFEKLKNKLLEVLQSKSSKVTIVSVELDDDQQQVRIIDSGTGVEYPIHICKKPFISLKTGEDYSTGKFGRGFQVFRAFCNCMEFYSLRDKPSKNEEQNIIDNNWDRSKIDVKSIHLNFPAKFPGGDYGFNDVKEYKKLSKNSGTGTVVVLSKWEQKYYEDLSKHLPKLEDRLQHHFGFALDNVFNIGLKIVTEKKEIEIFPLDFEELSEDPDSKIGEKFELPTLRLKDKLGNPCGEVEFHIYKTTRSYHDTYKEPFLIVNGRPLGDTALSEMPSISQHSEIWKSSTITGYIVCNSVEPNQLRTGLANTKAKQPFIDAVTSASIELKKLNTAWKNELSSARDVSMMNEVVDTVTRFLAKKGIKFNFKNPLQKGIQKDSKNTGEEITDDRVSNEAGVPNQGLIDSKEGETVQVGYRKTTTRERGGQWDENTIIVPHGSKKKDGNTIISVKVKRSLVSKGGRRIRKSYSGPDLDFNADEDCKDELSYFESDPPTVMIQSEHEAWKNLVKKAREQVNTEKVDKEKKNYLLERYLWELMNNKGIQKDEEISDEDRKNMFWTYYHDLIDPK